jgi:D-arabinose 1-dehydrogenase-like Zn-dependent alcohol dehydrogenase
MLQSLFIKKYKVIIGTAKVTSEQFSIISSLYTEGMIHPVINKVFTIDEVAQAYQLVDSKKKVGSVVLKIQEE